MSKINLLPWREEIRAQRVKRLMIGSVVLWASAAAIVVGSSQFVSFLQDVQTERNGFLGGEISTLDDEIKEIQDLRERRLRLVSRMEIIQNLQRDRTELVRVMDELAHTLPDGVYFSGMGIRDRRMKLEGRAQSNARVSSLMQNLDASPWFQDPALQQIDVVEDDAGKLSKFVLQIRRVGRQRSPREENFGDN